MNLFKELIDFIKEESADAVSTIIFVLSVVFFTIIVLNIF